MEFNLIDVGDIAAALALLVAAWAAIHARGSRKASDKSAGHAETSAKPATESAQQSKRSADAAEEATRLAQDQDARYDPIWDIRHVPAVGLGHLRRAVINTTGEVAYEVRVFGPGVTSVGPETVGSEGELVFDYRPPREEGGRAVKRMVNVHWRRPEYRGSSEQQWQGEITFP